MCLFVVEHSFHSLIVSAKANRPDHAKVERVQKKPSHTRGELSLQVSSLVSHL